MMKTWLRFFLSPWLPTIRALRTLPARRSADRLASALRTTGGLAVCYLTGNFPAQPALRTEQAHGGAVKMTFLAEHFPHSYPQASLLYTVSSVNTSGVEQIVRRARENGLKIVLNQNGVSYPAWNTGDWQLPNKKMRAVLQMADFIVYQSEFCRLGAAKFLGETRTPFEIIYNPVDTRHYQPKPNRATHPGPVLLLGGNQYERYRFETAVRVLEQTALLLPEVRMLVTGGLWGEDQRLSLDIARRYAHEHGVGDRLEFTGTYSQSDAPGIFQRADILVHTKYNDPSPNLIPEALASGLPVVYSASGGVPELVGAQAGIGIGVEQSWEKTSLPDPLKMALAIQAVWEKLPEYSDAARQQAVEQFPLEKFIKLHEEIFSRVLDNDILALK